MLRLLRIQHIALAAPHPLEANVHAGTLGDPGIRGKRGFLEVNFSLFKGFGHVTEKFCGAACHFFKTLFSGGAIRRTMENHEFISAKLCFFVAKARDAKFCEKPSDVTK